MSPLYGSNDELAVQFDLPRLLEIGLLEDGEIMCEVEGAGYGMHRGVLVVTDLAVHFLDRGILSPRSGYVLSIGLEEVMAAEVCASQPWQRRGSGAFAVVRARRPDDPEPRDVAGEDRPRYAELLAEGEVYYDLEAGVWLAWRLGSLFVTDRRIAYFMGGFLWPHRCVVSVPFDGYVGASVIDDEFGAARLVVEHGVDPRQQGARLNFKVSGRARAEELSRTITHAAHRSRDSVSPLVPSGETPTVRPGEPVRVVFDGVMGGPERADEIVQTILRQKDYLERLGPRADAALEVDPPDIEDETPRPPVLLGRGVVEWVNANGGRLFVWGDDFGTQFEWMKADVDPPDGVRFVSTESVAQFELCVEEGMVWSRPIRLSRRWFGLRDGIAVDTGLVTA